MIRSKAHVMACCVTHIGNHPVIIIIIEALVVGY